MTNFRSELLQDASQLVNGARNDAYGSLALIKSYR